MEWNYFQGQEHYGANLSNLREEAIPRAFAIMRDPFQMKYEEERSNIKIPKFDPTFDSEVYIQWEAEIEAIFEYHPCHDEEKVSLIISHFYGFASLWWFTLNERLRSERKPPITTWEALRKHMRSRFVLSSYKKSMLFKLQRLKQESLSVEDYYKVFKNLWERAYIEEDDEELRMKYFLAGLNKEIGEDVMKYTHEDLEDMVYYAQVVERRIKRRNIKRYASNNYCKLTPSIEHNVIDVFESCEGAALHLKEGFMELKGEINASEVVPMKEPCNILCENKSMSDESEMLEKEKSDLSENKREQTEREVEKSEKSEKEEREIEKKELSEKNEMSEKYEELSVEEELSGKKSEEIENKEKSEENASKQKEREMSAKEIVEKETSAQEKEIERKESESLKGNLCEVKYAQDQPLFVLVYKDIYFTLNPSLPSMFSKFLQEFKEKFSNGKHDDVVKIQEIKHRGNVELRAAICQTIQRSAKESYTTFVEYSKPSFECMHSCLNFSYNASYESDLRHKCDLILRKENVFACNNLIIEYVHSFPNFHDSMVACQIENSLEVQFVVEVLNVDHVKFQPITSQPTYELSEISHVKAFVLPFLERTYEIVYGPLLAKYFLKIILPNYYLCWTLKIGHERSVPICKQQGKAWNGTTTLQFDPGGLVTSISSILKTFSFDKHLFIITNFYHLNVGDKYSFDLRTNPFQEGGNDMNHGTLKYGMHGEILSGSNEDKDNIQRSNMSNFTRIISILSLQSREPQGVMDAHLDTLKPYEDEGRLKEPF